MSKRFILKNTVAMAIALIFVIVVCYSGFRIVGILNSSNEVSDDTDIDSKTIVKDGKSYYPRQDITVFMLIGVDQEGPKKDSGSYNNNGQADLISLIVFDEVDKTYKIMLLNRDTMTDIPILGIGGKPAGTINAQLALAHNQGSGLEDSCENMKKAINLFLGNIPIDYYFSLNMDAIAILNDAVGGVKVNVKDDFSQVDASIQKGEVLLSGEQALSFVQTRKEVGDQLNVTRMERHKQYMSGFSDAFKTKLNSTQTFVFKTYESVADYIVSDCSVNTLSNMLNRYSEYSLKEIVSPEGNNTKGEKYMEFYADEEKLEDLILNIFYSEKK